MMNKCKCCGQNISNKAKSCPNCGEPIKLSFEIDTTVTVKLDAALAMELADHVLANRCENPAVVALAYQLKALAND